MRGTQKHQIVSQGFEVYKQSSIMSFILSESTDLKSVASSFEMLIV